MHQQDILQKYTRNSEQNNNQKAQMLVQLITEQAAGVRICLNVITICLAALVARHNATNKLVLEMIYG